MGSQLLNEKQYFFFPLGFCNFVYSINFAFEQITFFQSILQKEMLFIYIILQLIDYLHRNYISHSLAVHTKSNCILKYIKNMFKYALRSKVSLCSCSRMWLITTAQIGFQITMKIGCNERFDVNKVLLIIVIGSTPEQNKYVRYFRIYGEKVLTCKYTTG